MVDSKYMLTLCYIKELTECVGEIHLRKEKKIII